MSEGIRQAIEELETERPLVRNRGDLGCVRAIRFNVIAALPEQTDTAGTRECRGSRPIDSVVTFARSVGARRNDARVGHQSRCRRHHRR